jgi:hypothetical protein
MTIFYFVFWIQPSAPGSFVQIIWPLLLVGFKLSSTINKMLQNVFSRQIMPMDWCCSFLLHLNRLVPMEQLAILSTVSVILVETMDGPILTNHPQNFGLRRWLLYLVILMMIMRSQGSMEILVHWSTPAMSQNQILAGALSIDYWNWEPM